VNRFADEIALGGSSVMIGDADSGDAPTCSRPPVRAMSRCAQENGEGDPGHWINMFALGLAGALAGLPRNALRCGARILEARRRRAARPTSRRCTPGSSRRRDRRWPRTRGPRARVVGAVAYQRQRGGGIRRRPRRHSVRRRPIRSRRRRKCSNGWRRRSPKVGGTLLQAEDELASSAT
jgi:hypothetical protein